MSRNDNDINDPNSNNNSNSEDGRIFEALLDFLRRSRGFDFTGYKRSSLRRRVTKRMQTRGIDDFGDYLDYLEVHPEEFVPLFNTILINVTGFFRDRVAWNYLWHQTLPDLLGEKQPEEPIRVWSAGCSSGEEAYTLAIILSELLGTEQFRQRVKIYATDVDEEDLMIARHATYSERIVENVPEELRNKYFEQNGENCTFRAELRRAVIFGRHDLIQDAPISRLDLLVCRNTMMYFNAETQRRILARFHFALDNNGILFLGKAEMLMSHSNLFTPLNLQHRIFGKVPNFNLRERLVALSQTGDDEAGSRLAVHVRLRDAAFSAAPVAHLVIDQNGSLVLANAQARATFNIGAQDLGRPFQDLEVSYRPLELRSQIEEVSNTRQSIAIQDVSRSLPNRETQYFDVHISPLQENGSDLIGVSITFTDVTLYHHLQEDLYRSNQDLETANEELQSSNEELETTNEELQSTNEELETTNEELQSTNEELETMNEELQSTNEELQTINDELRMRTEEVNQVNAFLGSILESIEAGVVVVDRHYDILTWNNKATDLWGLRADEVEGQSFFSLDIGLPIDRLRDPIRDCLSGACDRQAITLDATNRRGQSIRCQVSLTPLSGLEIQLRGAILLMEELAP
ncbi:MAG: CheR family methyltransferase [Elainellaceae cyanobacterium]